MSLPTLLPPPEAPNKTLLPSPLSLTMAMKRKLEADSNESSPVTKQLKLVPFPNMEPDMDVAMSDAEPLYPDIIHSRLHSNASSLSNASDSPTSDSSAYPTFDLYPMPFFRHDGSVDPDSHNYSHYSRQSSPNSQVGLLQPTSAFAHHGTNCTQIPKLRIACATTVNGQRSMWSHCEQCGAISMVESD
ncbi:unnamed protein product [Cyclocybe aegerita]|uniref:Uncharacterized protein n=1 Tax=Cyclocybe aegerita TaxID=1973307 RepID=A0A8S0VQ99_CYCAE|nr:unnamed protein product [Cyclocybe aegerita]